MATDTSSTDDARPSGTEWIERFAAQIGADAPDPATIEALLDIAGVAAHASERLAAPIACYLIGRVGADPAEVLAQMRS